MALCGLAAHCSNKLALARKSASVGLAKYSLVGKREKLTIKNGTQINLKYLLCLLLLLVPCNVNQLRRR